MNRDGRSRGSELARAVIACRRHLLVAAAFSLGLNLLYLSVPLYSLQVYDRILPSSSVSTLVMLTFAAMVALAVLAALDSLRARILARSGVRLERNVAPRLLDMVIERALALGPNERGQGLRDLELLRVSLSGPAILALFDLPWLPVYLIALFMVDITLGGFALVCGAVMLGLAIAQNSLMRGPLARAQEAAVSNSAFTEACLRNAEAVRALGMFPEVLKRWERDRVEMVRAQLEGSDRGAVVSSAIKFVRLLAQILILGVAAYLAIHQTVSPGAIFASAILMARAIQPVEQVVGLWKQVTEAHAAFARINALFTSHPARQEALELPRPQGSVSAEQAAFVPPGGARPVMQGLNFRLQPGEAMGIIGPTAAGKSTVARLVVGLYPPSAGEVRIDGAAAFTWARGSLGRHVGYLPQDIELFSGTVAENIARFRTLEDEEVIAAARLAGVHEIILGLPRGYETVIGPHGASLSGGQRQLIGLARAIYGTPSVVVLDEPNANLDNAGEAKLVDCLQKLKRAGSTTVTISHRMNLLHVMDRILVLQDGRMAGFGPRGEVLARITGVSTIVGARAGEM
jgi:ATP-binding cassette subfamily C protein/ATP-binding cassette subfamily C protein EexD